MKNKCEDCAGCNQWKCDCSNERAYAIEKFVKKFEKKIRDVKFTIGQTWEIQYALKQTLKEMTEVNDGE